MTQINTIAAIKNLIDKEYVPIGAYNTLQSAFRAQYNKLKEAKKQAKINKGHLAISRGYSWAINNHSPYHYKPINYFVDLVDIFVLGYMGYPIYREYNAQIFSAYIAGEEQARLDDTHTSSV